MDNLHHIVKITWDQMTGEMRVIDKAHCPWKNGHNNVCVADNGFKCKFMFETPAAIQKSELHFMMHCGYGHE